MTTTDDPSLSGDETARWVPPRPAEIPALHAALLTWLDEPFYLAVTCSAIEAGQGTIVPSAPSVLAAATILLDEEGRRLDGADLYAVDQEMTAQVVTAGEQLPDCSVQPSDLPAPQGLVVFGSPIGYSEEAAGITVPIVACSWGPSPYCAPPAGAVWLTFWSAPAYDHIVQVGRDNGISPGQARLMAELNSSPLVWDDEALLCWSADEPPIHDQSGFLPADQVDGIITKPRTLPWIRTVLATWLLIQQPAISEVAEQYAPRPARRRAEREGRPLQPVRVVRLQRRAGAPTATTECSARALTVRFPVRGFWRNQPYGKGQALRRRTWIDAHWRGPEDAPVLSRTTVTLVEAPAEPRE